MTVSNPHVMCFILFFQKREIIVFKNLGSGGFGVPVANILFAPYTPACAFPGTSMYRHFFSKAFALEFIQECSVSNPQFRGSLRISSHARNGKLLRNFWGVEDSNLRRLSQQIYSLPHLTALETPQLTQTAVFRDPVEPPPGFEPETS